MSFTVLHSIPDCAEGGRLDPGSGVPYPGRNAQGLHHNPRQLLLLPLGRLGKHRHPPLRGRFSCESAAPRPPDVPRSYRRHHGFFATDWPRGNVWSNSPNIWWPEDRAWCVATDIDLCYTYIGGSRECIEAILSTPDLEALPATLDASTYLTSDTINAPEKFQGGSE